MTSTRPRHFALRSAAVLTLGLLGCASTPGWKPGQPDDSTTQHYQLALTAIEAKDEKNAEAALQLLSDDVTRMETNTVTQAGAHSALTGVLHEVSHQKWDQARTSLLKWNASYGRP